jgi:N-acetylmuramoyl-L-alanine amidase
MKTKSNFRPLKLLFLFSLIVLASLAIMFFVTAASNRIRKQEETTVPETTTPPPNVTVIIDAGHGGEDGGAVGINGVLEKNINLDIAKKLRDKLVAQNIPVVMTRSDDIMLYDHSNTKMKRKTQDLMNRQKIALQYENAIFISIHMNSFPIEKYSGAQIYYSKNNPQSEIIANQIQSAFKTIQPNNTRQIKPADQSIFLLYRLNCPAILAECGFLSNSLECNKLSDDAYRTQVADVLFGAISKYVSQIEEST